MGHQPGKRILVIEDHTATAELLQERLEDEGFQVAVRFDGLSGLARVREWLPDLLVLDWGLPKLSGLDVCREIRRNPELHALPILMLTGRTDEIDRVVGLEVGADDYLTKPFSPRELVARVRALLRRAALGAPPDKAIRIGSLLIDPDLRRVTLDGAHVRMTVVEFRLLHFLVTHPNKVFSREELLKAVWGDSHHVTPRSVDTYFWRLRRKLEADPQNPVLLKSSRGTGYLFEIPANPERLSRPRR